MSTVKAWQVSDKFYNDRLGLVEIYSIESAHTLVVVDLKGKYFRVSGLSINLREALEIKKAKDRP